MKRRILILGGLGYLGWSLGVSLSLSDDAEVIFADNDSKLEWAKRVGGVGVNTGTAVGDRLSALQSVARCPVSFSRLNAHVYDDLAPLLRTARPDAIVNCAHQPSAPYSEVSQETAQFTLRNNVATHLNVLWCLKSLAPEVKYVEMNTAGALGNIDYVPAEKVPLEFTHQGQSHCIQNMWLPMQAMDVYHLSKAQNFLLSEMYATRFGLRITSVRQSVIFGVAPVTRDVPMAVLPPLYYDPVFGTVANRFVLQETVGIRPTVYGDGKQTSGLISLVDAVDAIGRCCMTEGRAGELEVLHNQSCIMPVSDIADIAKSGCATTAADPDVIEPAPVVKRRLAPSPLGPPARTRQQIAGAIADFKRRVQPFVKSLNVDSLAAAHARSGY